MRTEWLNFGTALSSLRDPLSAWNEHRGLSVLLVRLRDVGGADVASAILRAHKPNGVQLVTPGTERAARQVVKALGRGARAKSMARGPLTGHGPNSRVMAEALGLAH